MNGGSDTGLPFLQGSIGDKMWAEIIYEVHTESVDLPVSYTTNSITRTDCSVSGIGSFTQDGFKEGMDVAITGIGVYTINATILSVSGQTMVFTTNAIGSSGTILSDTVSVYDTTPIKATDFYYNCIGNNEAESFLSLSDVNTQKTSASWSGNPSNVNMTPKGSLAWFEGYNPVINYIGAGTINVYSRQYSIIVPFLIKPFCLSGTIGNLINTLIGISKPVPWQDTDCMGFLYQIDVKYLNTPTVNQSTGTQFANGNTGYFNEFLNGGQPNYNLVSINYVNSEGVVIPSIQVNDTTTITMLIGGPGITTGTPMVLNFCKIPISPGEYQNTKTNFRQDFFHDRAFTTVGAGSINGDQYNSSYQAITNFTITGDPLGAKAIFTINLGNLAAEALSDSSDANYMIWITPQNKNVTSLATTDRNAVLCDVNQAFVNTDDNTLLQFIDKNGGSNILFYKWPNYSKAFTSILGAITEYWQAVNQFKVKSGCKIVSYSLSVKAVNGSNNFSLLNQNYSLSQYFNGTYCDFDLVQNNPGIYPVGDPRNTINFFQNPVLNSPGYIGYEMDFPIQLDYRSWIKITNANNAFVNNPTQYWPQYCENGWKLKLIVIINVFNPVNGTTTQFQRICNITAIDDNNSYSYNYTLSYLLTYSNSKPLVQMAKQKGKTNIEVTITGDTSIPAGYTGIYGVIRLYYDNGVSQVLDEGSSEEAPYGSFIPQNGVGLILSVGTNVVTMSAVFDAIVPLNLCKIFADFGFK